jgi:Flp pilus assembly protein TadG
MRYFTMRRFASDERRDGGQVLVIFALALVAIVAMTGLVLDGGSTFVQRRDMQNVADNAAMAAAYAYGVGNNTSDAQAAARATAAANGYTDGVNGVSVVLHANAAGGVGRELTVTIDAPHANNFAGIVGMSSWQVSTTATTRAGWPNAVIGAMPIIFNLDAWNANGSGPDNAFTYHEPLPGSQDVPTDSETFNWTMYCDNCNADSNTVDDLILNGGYDAEVDLTQLITPLNAGSHATLYSDLAIEGIGDEFPVPIVDDNGDMVGFAMFHLTGSVGGSTKSISGYFVSPINSSNLRVSDLAPAGGHLGAYSVILIN